MYISYSKIMKEFKRPLDYKIAKAVKEIRKGFAVSSHHTAIAFSGGKDSTVLWHLIRTYFPDKHPYIIYGNTGVEYPESLRFARKLGKEWGSEYFHETKLQRTEEEGLKYQAQREILDWLIKEGRIHEVLKEDGKLKSTRTLEHKATPQMWENFRNRRLVWPKGTLMSYWWCADQYGFPILGKAASLLDARRINIDCFLSFSSSASQREKLLEYYDVLSECKFSQHCCKLIKKDPSEQLQAELDVDVIFKGLMASESQTRKTNFATRGYLFKSSRPHLGDDPFYHCNPLQIWTDDDIWEYIRMYDVPYSELYDMGYTDDQGVEHKIPRNGCYGCATAIMRKDNQLSMARRTHPRQWTAVMDYGMADELKKLYHIKNNGIPSIIGVFDSADELLENRPCAFDDIGDRLDSEGIDDEYDPDLSE
ncbi:MAG TPA: phosphoadenosine phosphosulfate reductase family protein [Bacillota bacterium]|nr:phosphoadenosine phosphosulfate reductase family protein [Bacillota bacterium]